MWVALVANYSSVSKSGVVGASYCLLGESALALGAIMKGIQLLYADVVASSHHNSLYELVNVPVTDLPRVYCRD